MQINVIRKQWYMFFLLSLIVCFLFSTGASAADGTAALTLDKTSYAPGDTIKLTVTLSDNDISFYGFYIKINCEKTLTCDNANAISLGNNSIFNNLNWKVSPTNKISGKGWIAFSLSDQKNPHEEAPQQNGELFTVDFVVPQTMEARDYSFSINVVSLVSYSPQGNIPLTPGNAVNFTVSGSGIPPVTTYKITTAADNGGSVSPVSPDVPEGGTQTFTITPDAGYSIIDVKVDGSSVLNDNAYSVNTDGVGTYTFTDVTKVHTIEAIFAYTITATAGANGAISPTSASVGKNGSQAFTITPDPGYYIDSVTVDDAIVASDDPNYSIDPATGVGAYTFRNVTADHSIAATFKPALSLDVELIDFGLVAAYSNEQPEKTITVTNNSDAAVAVPAPTLAWQSGGSYITVDQLYALDTTDMVTTLAAGATTTFIVKPQPGLPDGRWDLGVKGTVTLGTAKIVLKMVTVCTATIDPDASVGEHGTATINTDLYPCVEGLYYGGGYEHNLTPAWSLVADPGYVVDSCTLIKVNKDDGRQEEVIWSFAGQNLTKVDVSYAAAHVIFKSATFIADTKTYTITASVGEDDEYNEGAITPVDNGMDENGVVSVIRNRDQSFTITPDAGYHIDTVYVDNQAVTVTPDPITGIATYTFSSVNSNHTIAATFMVNSYTIAFDKNASDATGTMENMAMVYGTGAKLTANGFTRTDYTFAGWAVEPGGTVVYNDEAEVDIAVESNNATITLYAVWTGGPVPPNPVYTVTPVEDAVYSIGSTNDGIKTMTVNTGSSGLKYFTVNISPVVSHSGDETAVFVHLRNGAQLELNATTADFDEVQTAIAGYNVLPDDVVKIYVVDALSNALDFNPTILQ